MGKQQLHQEIRAVGGLTVSKNTNDISDNLSAIHHFIRSNKITFKGVATEEVLGTIEKYFHFEDTSDWREVKGYPSNLTPDPFLEDVYYGLAYVQDEHAYQAMEYLQETLVPLLNEIAPEGYAFMSHEGASSDLGFYPHE